MKQDKTVSISDIEIFNAARDKFASERTEFNQWSREKGLVATTSLIEILSEERNAVLALLAEEEQQGEQEKRFADSGSMADHYDARIGAGRVLHVKEATKVLLVDAIGLFLAYASGSGLPMLLHLWFGASILDILRKFKKCYERLKDADEIAIFEAIYELQSRLSVEERNSKKLHQLKAPVHVAESRLLAHLQGKISAERAASTLKSLKMREVLNENSDGWSIRFW